MTNPTKTRSTELRTESLRFTYDGAALEVAAPEVDGDQHRLARAVIPAASLDEKTRALLDAVRDAAAWELSVAAGYATRDDVTADAARVGVGPLVVAPAEAKVDG